MSALGQDRSFLPALPHVRSAPIEDIRYETGQTGHTIFA